MTEAAGPAWLKPGGVLIHIGPHKTGTTALQQSLATARPSLEQQGVIYPGDGGQHQFAALAVTSSRGMRGSRRPVATDWDDLVRDVASAAPRRVVVSAEVFDEADDDIAQRVVAGLGGPAAQVVMTLRPLAKICRRHGSRWSRTG